MITVYVQVDHIYGEVKNISLIPLRTNYIKAEMENPTIDLSNLAKYSLEHDEETDVYRLVYNEEKYESIVKQKEKDQAISDGKVKMEEMQTYTVLKYASDEDAYAMRYLYDLWKPDTDYVTGDRHLYNDILYKCKQNHTSQKEYTPDLIPALWDIVNGTNQGTKDNPIPIPEPFSSMEYVKGCYYLEDGTLYLMNRQGMEDGETISLTYKPSALVGHYFEIVEN